MKHDLPVVTGSQHVTPTQNRCSVQNIRAEEMRSLCLGYYLSRVHKAGDLTQCVGVCVCDDAGPCCFQEKFSLITCPFLQQPFVHTLTYSETTFSPPQLRCAVQLESEHFFYCSHIAVHVSCLGIDWYQVPGIVVTQQLHVSLLVSPL